MSTTSSPPKLNNEYAGTENAFILKHHSNIQKRLPRDPTNDAYAIGMYSCLLIASSTVVLQSYGDDCILNTRKFVCQI